MRAPSGDLVKPALPPNVYGSPTITIPWCSRVVCTERMVDSCPLHAGSLARKGLPELSHKTLLQKHPLHRRTAASGRTYSRTCRRPEHYRIRSCQFLHRADRDSGELLLELPCPIFSGTPGGASRIHPPPAPLCNPGHPIPRGQPPLPSGECGRTTSNTRSGL